ncbi:hypothetical protein DICPUDRAFT_80932 [Dictyostelium purpureum]|uniref:Signal recognition particle 14 kDa protein n=1 Tax=Dictyostelium purpureum TaxID=5786 RepID=F0ZRZ4_DICPU|nr:uncharacterized protein DICPUDRAFT_80932 [Dictyostelium purpureum]EGC33293.1 hypothetical protein DICPUDRAFT_80932 [Dictyostelium purpureum]|eukprot:XP_003290194.1 hypothetical protein DICPUDRAFT_80932 [Dictyostelium purpureum]
MFLENEAFLTALNKLYQTSTKKGTVWTTMKRYVDSDSNFQKKKADRINPETTEEEIKCLVRSTNGKKKISTIVLLKDIPSFEKSYKNVLLLNLDNLKAVPKEKKKQINTQVTAATKKKTN